MRAQMPLQLRVQPQLHRQGFHDRFQHEVATPYLGQVGGRTHPAVGNQLHNPFAQLGGYRIHGTAEHFWLGVVNHYRHSMSHMSGRDGRAHHAGADDPHAADLPSAGRHRNCYDILPAPIRNPANVFYRGV